ncbi:hypothetical protein N9N28_03035 [Rubripirellula amarantea]|uniref:Uncharacterized protein n=1 Tax=Rubripirellula amarantea TaxID=2527999 RepID=A0A5C5WNR0_9BACT|nr:hypothetical protein [Rubripirellula amarantea]MDA8743587.1 hypothetical protein [Rubripirellula amarantea]TWT52464.1 hypothetical protein Pla22_00880 [Rubripirellula amarantea]
MVARDDSVIRGSLIACMIFLVLSLALNFFLWRWGSTLSTEAETASSRMQTTSSQVRAMESKLTRLKAMLGVGSFTQAQIDEMKSNSSDDPDMQLLESQFATDMSVLGAEVPPEDRNYHRLPEFLLTAIRDRNAQYAMARTEATQIRVDAEAEIDNAKKSKDLAEQKADQANKKVATLSDAFAEDRARMNQEKEETKDKLSKVVQEFNGFRKKATDEKSVLEAKTELLSGTIDTQKKKINVLQNDRFETAQGLIRFVNSGGKLVTINLGSADALRPNVTFGVIDGDETRLQDADLKASIQVIKVQGPHLALARVVALPEIRNPIIPGDKIYSPFWAPGRRVKIALAGEIDINNDGRPDNEDIKGQIKAAGGVVAAEVSPTGEVTGTLDATIRFLVVGEAPEVSSSATLEGDDAEAAAAFGRAKELAGEYGITIIPAWKLEAYLKTIDDTLTTPLGSAVRADDFEPESIINRRRIPTDISDMYKIQRDNVQEGNRVLAP